MSLFAKISGLEKLAQTYPAKEQPAGHKLEKQTLKIGSVRFRNCATIVFNHAGLYLQVTVPFRKVWELYVPWDEITRIEKDHLYSKKAFRLIIGNPEIGCICVYESMFLLVHPFLRRR